MAEKTFEISIEGQDVSPETVRLRDLFDILHAFETAVVLTASQRTSEGGTAELHLVGIKAGSATCSISVAPPGLAAAILCAEAIRKQDLSTLPAKARNGLLEISTKARRRNWTIRLFDAGSALGATISPETAFVEDATIAGVSSLSGKLERIGGSATPTANFLLADGRRFTADVASQELAAQLAPLLYHFVSVDGEAKWSSFDMALVDFRITGIGSYEEDSNVLETLGEMAKISAGFWDEIDPDEYIADLRSEHD